MTLALVGFWLTGAVVSASPILLDRAPDKVVALQLAESSRDVPETNISIDSQWRVAQTAGGVRTWETTNPIRPRTLFFHRAPKGMKLRRIQDNGRAKKLDIDAEWDGAVRADTWMFSTHSIKVRRALSDGPPGPGEYQMRYPKAITREKSLNRSMSDMPNDKAFVFRSLQVGDTSRHGLLLPAPSQITFELAVPEAAVLRFDARILPPEAALAGEQSDGAQVVIKVGAEIVATVDVEDHEQEHRLNLSRWAGQSVRLVLETQPGKTSMLDYVFLAEPTLYTPAEDPPRVVMVFIDTLRPDHMSLYGYERDTSPGLDAWAKDAAVFTQARSIAPWTLPSARTMLTGKHPERWDKTAHLQNLFADAGWSTGFMAGNVYLSSNFEMAEGWGVHRCINWPQASVQVDRALHFLEDHEDQPAFLLLHLMDMHLPYTEPLTHRYRFAGDTPETIGDDYFLRKQVTRGAKSEEDRQYVRDRYDNNLRYIDDHLARIFDQLGPEDTVIVTSDHGEEFWDHGGFEHGHTLYDELLRVPMVLKGPGVTAGRFDEPVSLLDVTPTLAAMAGLPSGGTMGWDLRELANGSQRENFAARPHAFGRPLYGLRQWGSLKDGWKYTVRRGKEYVYNLQEDPQESTNLSAEMDTVPYQVAMSEALDRPVQEALRIVPNHKNNSTPVRVTLRNPGGFQAAWAGGDPTNSGRATVAIEPDKVVARWPKQRGRVEAYVVPLSMAEHPVFQVDLKVGATTETLSMDISAADNTQRPTKYLSKQLGKRTIEITSTVVPLPTDVDGDIQGFDPEVAGDLESLGYVGD